MNLPQRTDRLLVKRDQVNGSPFCLSVTGVYRGRVFIEVAMHPAQGFKPNSENFLRCKISRFERVAGEGRAVQRRGAAGLMAPSWVIRSNIHSNIR
jgi:hypothetical protein